MELSEEGKIFITSLEGICLNLYLDSVNVRTIAIGATVSEIPNIAELPWTYSITMKEAFELLDKSLGKYVRAINNALKVNIKQHQFDSLVSICYNIGTGGATGSTFMKRINAGSPMGRALTGFVDVDDFVDELDRTAEGGSYEEAIEERSFAGGGTIADAIMMWKHPKEIIGRRKKEVRLYTTGYYGDGKALVFPVNSSNHKPNYSRGRIVDVKDYL